ncbi:type I DNA topoisomerase [Candidatus Parcubacteria bacterium]|nr:type I DNA topoisomerase [Candidatus Parcubacteria bacterium]
MKLIIVESPTKARTIKKFLGSSYKVESSFGHIRDLEKKKMGIDLENNYKPTYIIPLKAKKQVAKLRDLAKKADEIILAPDEDREGEAIAWHLAEALKLDIKKTQRIVFHEITKSAILAALENPKKIDMDLVDAQQARRILDRLVGFELSPFLWKKITFGLSAGRVQSVAVRLIIEREREIKAFNSEEYWSLTASFQEAKKQEMIFDAKLSKINKKSIPKLGISKKAQIDKILKELKSAKYNVLDIVKKTTKKKPPTPFTTSTLQQTANRFLGFSAKKTMMVAQQLYEGLNLGGDSGGLITYMRTDSFNLSSKFLFDASKYLKAELGNEYAISKPRVFKTKSKGAQEAHEAIRPTEASRTPDSIRDKINNDQYRLYNLIWQRSIATQMPEAIVDAITIDIEAVKTKYQFRATGQTIKFQGYLKIYPEKSKEIVLPSVNINDELKLEKLNPEQHFTQPPARYSDATLVKVLEEHGIGRPSTYAPTIATIEARNYVFRNESKRLEPTEIAFTVVDLLINHFKNIVDYKFTADLENKLDEIAEGKNKWQETINNFYKPFHSNLENKYNEVNKKDIMPEEKTNEICDKCKSPMIIKTGRYGKFMACSNYPECRNVKNLKQDGTPDKEGDDQLKALQEKYKDEKCDKCGAQMTVKNGRFGPFLACSGYPACKNIKGLEENKNGTGIKCPKCGKGEIVQKKSARGVFYACDAYPDCKNAYWSKPTGEKCPDCGALLVEVKDGAKCSEKGCRYKK